jgi:hypothetical protein
MEIQLETKKIFLLITVILLLLTSPANASLRGASVDTANLNDHFILKHTKIATEDDGTNFFLNGKPASFHHDFKAPNPRGPQPGNPGYPHFIVRPGVGGNPPVAPEPVSSLLFLVGGAVLAGLRYFKRRK